MNNRLPPLTALRAFDAAARHMSFAKAAEELHVTPAALSFQIKSLEEHLGAPLFVRMNRAVALTEAGKALVPGTRDGFESLVSAWRAAARTLEAQTLTVTAGPAFTAKWLAPRLYQFALEHPEIELRFSASLGIVDLARDPVDVAIRFGKGQDEALFSHPFADEWVSPVMTPELAARFPHPEDLHQAVLIEDESLSFLQQSAGWKAWFDAVGCDAPEVHGPRFSQADHAIDAALAGVGVVLGRRSLVVKDIADGRLVAPYGKALNSGARFRFLCASGNENRPHIRCFLDWMLAEIEKTAFVSERLDIISVK